MKQRFDKAGIRGIFIPQHPMEEVMRKIALVFVLLAAACGEDVPQEDTAEATPDVLSLPVVDSIGVELGDSAYVFGAIADAEVLPDGNIIVLDRTFCSMRIFTPEGEHVRTIAGMGSGPGELSNPFSLFNWGNGEISVIDPYAGGIHRYTINGEWLGLELPITNNSFIDPVVVSPESFVCFKSRFDQEGDGITATAFVSLFPMSIEPEVTYWEKSMPWDPGNMGNLALEAIFSNYYTADPSTGMVYISPYHGDGYSILCCNADGSSAGEITAEYTPVPKTEEEIQAEKDFIEFFLRASENNNPNLNYSCDPWPNHFAVTGLYIGPSGNLWAMRGGTETVEFDIWGGPEEFIGKAVLPDLSVGGASWKFAFGENTAAAWNENPDDFQKLYVIDLSGLTN